MADGNEDGSKKLTSPLVVPRTGGEPPEPSLDPVMPVGPNPELAKGMPELVRGDGWGQQGRGHTRAALINSLPLPPPPPTVGGGS